MKVGDLVEFPCDTERYQLRVGVLLGVRDNSADVYKPKDSKDRRVLFTPPRKVADILYQGKMKTCWAHNLKEIV